MLAKWSPFPTELINFEKAVRSFFDAPIYGWRPAMDVYEDKETITLEAELPGVELKDVSVTVDDGILTVKGEKKFTRDTEKKSYFRVERAEGTFVRSFTLPLGVESEKIDASYNNGILVVQIPKKPEKIPRQVKIKNTA